MSKKILVAYGVDVDAVAGWLGSYGGEDSPDDISRGMFAGEVGTPRPPARRCSMRRGASTARSWSITAPKAPTPGTTSPSASVTSWGSLVRVTWAPTRSRARTAERTLPDP